MYENLVSKFTMMYRKTGDKKTLSFDPDLDFTGEETSESDSDLDGLGSQESVPLVDFVSDKNTVPLNSMKDCGNFFSVSSLSLKPKEFTSYKDKCHDAFDRIKQDVRRSISFFCW